MNAPERMRAERVERWREEEHEALQKQGDLRQLARLARYLAPRRASLFLAIALSLGIAALTPIPMVIVQKSIDGYIIPGNMGGLAMMAGLLCFLQLCLFGMEVFSGYLVAKIGQYSMRDLRMELFRHVQSQPLKFFDKNPVGRLMTRLTSDVNTLNELFAQGVVGIFQQVLSLVAIVGVLAYYNWRLTLWVMVVMPIVLLASWNFRNRVFVSFRLVRVRLARLNTFMQENLTGMRTVQANTREQPQFEIFEQLNDRHREAHLQNVFQYALFFPAIEVAAAIGFAIVLWKGGMEYLAAEKAALVGAVTVGQLALFVQALERFFEPIKDLSEKYNTVQAAIASGERLFNLLDTKPAIADPEAPVSLPARRGNVEFKDAWFAYNEEEWVLRGVSFTVERGQMVAIIGPTGSGKTTITSLLGRFYELQRGDILIDGTPIKNVRQADLRGRMAFVLQDVFLFNGSIAENISMGNPAIDLEKVKQVCEETGFADFVARMPRGYDTGVRERGALLSTGQKQLLNFARALAHDPEILVLDEATANVDTESEVRLQAAMAKLCAGRTSIVIAHRLSTIQRADKILVLHKGHLVEQGTHQELLGRDGLYRRLYELQYQGQAATA